jgi:hypothetical protein
VIKWSRGIQLTYFMHVQTYEWEADYSPAWRFVGKHMHWQDSLVQLTHQYLDKIVGRAPNGEFLPVSTVQICG